MRDDIFNTFPEAKPLQCAGNVLTPKVKDYDTIDFNTFQNYYAIVASHIGNRKTNMLLTWMCSLPGDVFYASPAKLEIVYIALKRQELYLDGQECHLQHSRIRIKSLTENDEPVPTLTVMHAKFEELKALKAAETSNLGLCTINPNPKRGHNDEMLITQHVIHDTLRGTRCLFLQDDEFYDNNKAGASTVVFRYVIKTIENVVDDDETFFSFIRAITALENSGIASGLVCKRQDLPHIGKQRSKGKAARSDFADIGKQRSKGKADLAALGKQRSKGKAARSDLDKMDAALGTQRSKGKAARSDLADIGKLKF
jgi:hypothetical protein